MYSSVQEFMNRVANIFILFIFLMSINFSVYGEEAEAPFEYNSRWYRNDFNWWNIWQKEFYKNLGKNIAKDVYNAGQVIESINRLKRWVLPEKAELFEGFIEFYGEVKEEVEKGNLRRPGIKSIQSRLKRKAKEFITKFHYKNINPEEWICNQIKDKSLSEKVEIMPVPIISAKEKTGYRYIAHRNGRIFHKRNCEEVKRIKEGDRIYFKTKRRALSTRCKPCRECKP